MPIAAAAAAPSDMCMHAAHQQPYEARGQQLAVQGASASMDCKHMQLLATPPGMVPYVTASHHAHYQDRCAALSHSGPLMGPAFLTACASADCRTVPKGSPPHHSFHRPGKQGSPRGGHPCIAPQSQQSQEKSTQHQLYWCVDKHRIVSPHARRSPAPGCGTTGRYHGPCGQTQPHMRRDTRPV